MIQSNLFCVCIIFRYSARIGNLSMSFLRQKKVTNPINCIFMVILEEALVFSKIESQNKSTVVLLR